MTLLHTAGLLHWPVPCITKKSKLSGESLKGRTILVWTRMCQWLTCFHILTGLKFTLCVFITLLSAHRTIAWHLHSTYVNKSEQISVHFSLKPPELTFTFCGHMFVKMQMWFCIFIIFWHEGLFWKVCYWCRGKCGCVMMKRKSH